MTDAAQNPATPPMSRTGRILSALRLVLLGLSTFGAYLLWRLAGHWRRRRAVQRGRAVAPRPEGRFGLGTWTVVVLGAWAWFLLAICTLGPVADATTGWRIP